jgi:hypothetical protein
MTTPLSYFLDDSDKRRQEFAAWAIENDYAVGHSFWGGAICSELLEAYIAGRDFEASKHESIVTVPVVTDTNWHEVNTAARGV